MQLLNIKHTQIMKIKTITLPFLSMQEGEDQTPEQPIKSRNDLFVEGLGLSEQVKESLMNNETTIDEVVKSFQGSYSNLLKATHQTNWDEERKNALITETQAGSHNAFQSKLLKKFGLDAEKFKDVDKKTEAIINAASENYQNQLKELKTKLENTSDATSQQLEKQLETRNAEFKTLQTELEELRKFKEEFPNIKEQILSTERDRLWTQNQIAQASDAIQNKNSAASLNLINLLINQVATVEVIRDDKGQKSIVIKNKATDAPFMRSATDNYKDISVFITEEILKKNKLINLQNPTSNGTHILKSSNNKTTKSNKISSRAAERAK